MRRLVMTKADSAEKAVVVGVANDVYEVSCVDFGDYGGRAFIHVTSSRKHDGIVDLMWAVDADFRSGANDL